MDNEVFVTIVTVCRNAEKYINKTIKSVASLNYNKYEYLIIDGASSDDTLKICEEYTSYFENKGIRYLIVSEHDTGVYNAMNKALNYAKGEWIIYINAGDTIYKNDIFDKLLNYDISNKDVICANVFLNENHKYKKATAGKIDTEGLFSPICHQGVLVKTELMKEYRFDESLRLASDYDLLLRLYKDNHSFMYLDVIVSVFLLGGMSSKQSVSYLREMHKVRERNGIGNSDKLWIKIFKLRIFSICRFIGKTVLHSIFYSKKRGWNSIEEI